jgi:misacylated tRNA(Ala) deacylase
MILSHGQQVAIVNTIYAPDRSQIAHVLETDAVRPAIGDTVTVQLHWELRFKRMRVHTALHLLTTVLPYPVTGGAIGDGEGRLDFDIPDAGLDRDELTAELNRRIDQHAAVSYRWISDEELDVLLAAGARPVRLGPQVLRTSTAAAVALGAIGVLTGRWR